MISKRDRERTFPYLIEHRDRHVLQAPCDVLHQQALVRALADVLEQQLQGTKQTNRSG
jgi:hypothetical protein